VKTYIILTGIVFGLLALVHLWRLVGEPHLASDPWLRSGHRDRGRSQSFGLAARTPERTSHVGSSVSGAAQCLSCGRRQRARETHRTHDP
jgi:hypothetical protein